MSGDHPLLWAWHTGTHTRTADGIFIIEELECISRRLPRLLFVNSTTIRKKRNVQYSPLIVIILCSDQR